MMSSTATRDQFAPGLDIPEARDHGTDVSVADFKELDNDEAQAKLATLSRAERMQVLFGFEPFDYQRDLIDHTEQADTVRVGIQPGRQVGKTLTGAALAADDAATVEGEDTMIAAPFQETADEMMREAKRLLRVADERLSAIGLSLGAPDSDRNKREWGFDHGGRLLSRTLGVDGVGQRGKNPRFVIVDEAAYAADTIFEDVLEPFFLTHDEYSFILTSTPAGDAGYYHEKVVLDDDWHSPYWPSAISPLVDPEWLDEKQHKTEARTFRQEYLGEFIGSSDRFFSPELIDAATDSDVTSNRNDLVALGADIARAGDDRTVIIGIDARGVADVLVSDADLSLTEATGKLTDLYERHGPDTVTIDETGLGAGVVEMLESEIGAHNVEGVKFTIDRKQSLYNSLKSALEQDDITLAHHPRLTRECKRLTYSLTAGSKTKISHPDGGHDDHPDALVLAADATVAGPGPRHSRVSTITHAQRDITPRPNAVGTRFI
jgi:Terminase-like family.